MIVKYRPIPLISDAPRDSKHAVLLRTPFDIHGEVIFIYMMNFEQMCPIRREVNVNNSAVAVGMRACLSWIQRALQGHEGESWLSQLENRIDIVSLDSVNGHKMIPVASKLFELVGVLATLEEATLCEPVRTGLGADGGLARS
jgi:hypothetical protein